MSEPTVSVIYTGKLTGKFGVLVMGVRYRVDASKPVKLELPKSHAQSLLATAPDVWQEFHSPDMPAFQEEKPSVVPMSKRFGKPKEEATED